MPLPPRIDYRLGVVQSIVSSFKWRSSLFVETGRNLAKVWIQFRFSPVSVGLDRLPIHGRVRHVRIDKAKTPGGLCEGERVTPFVCEIVISYAGDLRPKPDPARGNWARGLQALCHQGA